MSIGKHFQLQSAFETVFRATCARSDAAMFTNRESDLDHTYWFSPPAATLFSSMLAAFGAVRCAAPHRHDVEFIAGDAAAAKLLRARSKPQGIPDEATAGPPRVGF